jgi:exosortase
MLNSEPKSGKSKIIIILVIAAAGLGILYWPTLRWLVNVWMTSDFYSHGFLVPLIAAFFVWTKREHLKNRNPSIIGVFVLITGVLLYILGHIWEFKFMSALSLWLVLASLVLFTFGIKTAKHLTFPWLYLLFMIPFPFVETLTYRLQEISLFFSSALLRLVGLPIATSGADIYLGTSIFTIGIPCSGIDSLIALMALAAVYVYFLDGSVPKRVILFVLAIPIAIVSNILRITSIILVAHLFNIQNATGWYHDLASPLMFFIGFLLLIFVGYLMRFRFKFEKAGI